jgi:glycerol-3-phosphate cytidylyltransferase
MMKKVLVYGRYDRLSSGHIGFLKKARAFGDHLVVALTTDECLEECGARRCELSYHQRKEALLSLCEVDEVVPEISFRNRKEELQKLGISVLALGERDKPFGDLVERFCEVHYVSSGLLDIPFLVICTGQACSLRCRDCGNFSPYAPAETKQYPAERIIHDLSMILNHCSTIDVLQIQGGEPFLHPDLYKILGFAVEHTGVNRVTVATN